MIALTEACRAGLFRRDNWLANVVAGAVVGIVALPLAMAFAIASGAKPEQGIYTAIVAGLAVSAFGGTRASIAGPTGAFIVILASITARYGIDGLQVATLMAGAILLLLGFAKMGGLIRFIPAPVILGFTAGIAVVIFVGQWQGFFGLAPAVAEHFHQKLWQLLQALPNLHPATTLLAALSLLLVMFTNRIPGLGRVPGPLVALVAATALQAAGDFQGVVTIGSAFGGIPRGLPALHIPDISVARMLELVGPAFTIAMLGAIESLLCAVVADGMGGTKHDSDQELIGQGVANLAAPLFGGFAATGALARTATNIRNGGNSPLAGLTHVATLICVILFLAPLAAHVPLAALSAILFVVAWNMSEARHFIRMIRRAPRADVVILLVTFSLTVFADLVVAVNIGVILAMLQFMRRMATSVDIQSLSTEALNREFPQLIATPLPTGVLVFAIDGPLFFGAVEKLEQSLAAAHSDPRVIILRMRWVPFMDITGLQTLEDAVAALHRRGVRVLVCGANATVKGKLEKAGVVTLIGSENFFDEFTDAVAVAKNMNHSNQQSSTAPR